MGRVQVEKNGVELEKERREEEVRRLEARLKEREEEVVRREGARWSS